MFVHRKSLGWHLHGSHFQRSTSREHPRQEDVPLGDDGPGKLFDGRLKQREQVQRVNSTALIQ